MESSVDNSILGVVALPDIVVVVVDVVGNNLEAVVGKGWVGKVEHELHVLEFVTVEFQLNLGWDMMGFENVTWHQCNRFHLPGEELVGGKAADAVEGVD